MRLPLTGAQTARRRTVPEPGSGQGAGEKGESERDSSYGWLGKPDVLIRESGEGFGSEAWDSKLFRPFRRVEGLLFGRVGVGELK